MEEGRHLTMPFSYARDDHHWSMRSAIVPRYFILAVFLLLGVIAAYVFFEARRFQQELLRQTEAKGAALAEAMESNIRNSILGNSLLEDLIGQRLIDNARLIDQLLQFPPVDQALIQEVARANGLRKIELLDLKGQPWGPVLPAQQRREQMMARMPNFRPDQAVEQRRTMMTFMWGRRWRLPQAHVEPPSQVIERKFWEGSVFGVAVGAATFPGIIAVHANADYILNFRKEIDVQRHLDELGRQSDVEHVALIDPAGKILAHTDRRLINQLQPALLRPESATTEAAVGRVVEQPDGVRRYDVVRAVHVNGSPVGFLEIGLSLQPMESAWRRSLRSMAVFGAAILVVGILGMGTIFYLQQGHVRKISLMEAEISRRQRLSELGNMAATVAHEIRNPLNSVSIGLQRLKNEFTPTQDAADYSHFLDLMQREVSRLNGSVEQFLSLARPLNLKPEKFSVAEFLSDLTDLTGGEANASNVRMAQKLFPALPPLEADRDYLKQLLLNLILNGIQAMPDGGTLTMAARPDKDFLELTVSDEGMGMAQETMRRIFEPYFTTKANGSGLGLSIARRIVEAHHGSIAVDSAPGKGSRFQIRLPFKFAGT
jgi:signal transduction histidine kinase